MTESSAREEPVTIIVTTYHRPGLLAKTLESIASLLYPRDKIHVVVVRDYTDSEAMRVVEEFKRRHGFVVKIVTVNGGTVSRARNTGILSSTTEIVAVVDDDIVLHPRTVEAALRILRDDRVAAVGFPAISSKPALSEKLHAWKFVGTVSYNASTVMPVTFYRRSVLLRVGLYREDMGPPASIHEDWELGSRIRRRGYLVVVEGRVPQRHLLEERKRSSVNRGVASVLKSYTVSYIHRNWWTLFEVLRVSPLGQKAEYAFYYLLPYTLLVLLLYQPLLSLALAAATGLGAIAYYLAKGYYSRLTPRERLIYPVLLVGVRALRAQLSLIGLLRHAVRQRLGARGE